MSELKLRPPKEKRNPRPLFADSEWGNQELADLKFGHYMDPRPTRNSGAWGTQEEEKAGPSLRSG